MARFPSLGPAHLCHHISGGRGRRFSVRSGQGHDWRDGDEHRLRDLWHADGASSFSDIPSCREARVWRASRVGDSALRARHWFVAVPDGLRLVANIHASARTYFGFSRPVRHGDGVFLLRAQPHFGGTVFTGPPIRHPLAEEGSNHCSAQFSHCGVGRGQLLFRAVLLGSGDHSGHHRKDMIVGIDLFWYGNN